MPGYKTAMGLHTIFGRALPSRLAFALVLLIAGCSSSEPPHSDCCVVFFSPASSERLPEGRAALARASDDAHRGDPREILITGYLSADGTGRDLSRQRMQAVKQALLGGGTAAAKIREAPETVPAEAFAQLGNGVTIQIERGALPETDAAKPAQGD